MYGVWYYIMPKRRPAPTQPPRHVHGTTSRAITSADVDRAADALLHAGERPTIEKVRLKIGRGSPNTINPLLDQWWQRLAGRLDSGPAALHRLPQAVAMAAESLWMNALEEARERASIEQRSTRKALAQDKQEQALRSHILSIREAELNDRLAERDRRIAQLEMELQSFMTLFRKEQASRRALERRLAAVSEATPAGSKAAKRPAGSKAPKTTAKSKKPARSIKKSTRKPAPAKRKLARTKRRD